MNKALAVLTLGCLAAASTQASTFFTETFTYPDGTLTAVSGGNWTAHSGAGAKAIQVTSGEVSLQQNAGSGEDINRNTGSIMGAGDKWYAGFDVTVTGGNTDVYFAHFLQGTGTFQNRTFVTAGTAGDFTFGIGQGSAGTNKWGADLSFGTKYRVVVAYDFDTQVNTLWVDPLLESDPSISFTSTFQTPITSFALRQSTGDSFQVIDNVSVATTFAEALVVPEPSTLALGGFGLLALLMARRRS